MRLRKQICRNYLLSVLLISSISCSKKQQNNDDQSNADSEQIISPTVDIKFPSELWSSRNKLFFSEGLGGIGESFVDSGNKLNQFSGIVVNVSNGSLQNISIESDEKCKNLFSYDANTSSILIDNSHVIDGLNCKLSANVDLKSSKSDKIVPKNFTGSINFYSTLEEKYNRNDEKIRSILSSNNESFDNFVKNLKVGIVRVQNNAIENIDFLHRFKEKVITLDLTNSSVSDLNSLKEFKNVKKLVLDSNRMNLKNVLNALNQIDSLSIKNSGIQSIREIFDIIPELKELDISGNTNISDLYIINNFKLNSLSIRNIYLDSIRFLENNQNITELDISDNPLKRIHKSEYQVFASLKNLESLNISINRKNLLSTPINDEILKDYFHSFFYSNNYKLKKFIARNDYKRMTNDYVLRRCDMINNFDNVYLGDIKSLEYIDIHGQGCSIEDEFGKIGGITNLSTMPFWNGNLKYINISNTNVSTFDYPILNVRKFEFILNETPCDKTEGINMSKSSCQFIISKKSPNYNMCDVLK
ncbi:hypothetical protein [Fluviispira sanaruensis]|uniref:Uncharacterized protein n=1 Tax=Fluviispira sanaruensis TaxID=2493639 RepID=A0A4P2VMJ2_FLUSA|nr:hypothetical protein [Fluviispira sanaruensis]BBH54623.1 hypothetical protein JCM31447_30970 [Fluviispira sanaruensis]